MGCENRALFLNSKVFYQKYPNNYQVTFKSGSMLAGFGKLSLPNLLGSLI
jgi:hypothetical protein